MAGEAPHDLGKEVLALLEHRHCTRAFIRDKEVPTDIIRSVLFAARNAPSSQDSQPWQVTVLTGKSRDMLSAKLLEAHVAGVPAKPDYVNRPAAKDITEKMGTRIAEYGKTFFDIQGIDRNDAKARDASRARNFEFFDAPVELIIHIPAKAVAGMYIDAGLFIENIILGFLAHGIGTCPQYSVASYSPIVREYLGMGDDRIVICGVAVGYPDTTAKINTYLAPRMALEEYTVFLGDEDVGKAGAVPEPFPVA